MIYSSNGEVYDSELHHQLNEPQEEKPVIMAENPRNPITGRRDISPGRIEGEGGGGSFETVYRPAIKYGEDIYKGPSHAKIMGDIENKIGRNIDFDKDSIQDGFLTSSGRFVDRKEAIDIASKAGQLEPNLPMNSDIGLIKENIKPMKLSSSPVDRKPDDAIADLIEKDEHSRAMDAYAKSADFPTFMMTKSSDLEDVKPSENIEHRGSSELNYATVAKDILKTALFDQPSLKETGKLRKDIGLKDLDKSIQEGIDRTKLRKFGRGVLDEEGERRFREDFPEVADEIIARNRKRK